MTVQVRYRYYTDIVKYEKVKYEKIEYGLFVYTFKQTPIYGPKLEKLRVIRTTVQGVWIDYYGEEKFVLNGRGKRFAHENIEWAFESYKLRTKYYIRRLENQLARAKQAEYYAALHEANLIIDNEPQN